MGRVPILNYLQTYADRVAFCVASSPRVKCVNMASMLNAYGAADLLNST
jgi:hypothetical protein